LAVAGERNDSGQRSAQVQHRALSALLLVVLAWLPAHSEQAAVADERYAIAVIGTGNMGSALGPRLAAAGHRVVYGSRDPARATVEDLVRQTGPSASAGSQAEAVRDADIVILAVPWPAVESLIPTLGDLSGKIIIDITTGDRQGADGYPELAVETSTSELIRDWAPGARVVKTPFAGAATVRDPLADGEPVVTYLAADDRHAKEVVARLAIELDFFPLDAGPLRMAKTIDHLGILYLTPLVQGRDVIYRSSDAPRLDVAASCADTTGWFEPVIDAGHLARFPNQEIAELECPDIDVAAPD
jgi:predicted dinucleotide-binding enzyme